MSVSRSRHVAVTPPTVCLCELMLEQMNGFDCSLMDVRAGVQGVSGDAAAAIDHGVNGGVCLCMHAYV